MAPLIVNTSDPMAKVRVVTTKDYSTRTLKTLHTTGVLHVEESQELKPVDREAIEGERRRVGELLAGINDILAYIPKGEGISLAEDVEVIYTRPFDELDSEVRLLCTKLGNMHQRATRLNQDVKELAELTRYLGSLDLPANTRLKDFSFSGSYLCSRVLVFPNESFETSYSKLRDHILESLSAVVENETVLYIIAKVENQGGIESAVENGGGRVLPIPGDDLTLGEFLGAADHNIHGLQEELAKLHAEIESETRENLERLVLFREALLAEAERLAVLEKACQAKYVTLIEGWMPEGKTETAIADLREKVGYVFIDTRKPEQAEEPPTRMRNAAAVRPFEVIVNLFGTPKYREWDPTPITAYFFAVFFGIMLGDVVYSALLILFARLGLRLLVDDPKTEGFKLFQKIIYISGGVGLLVGFLTGSYLGNFYQFFGIESLTLTVFSSVQAVFSNPVSFIQFSIVMGLLHVNIAHLLALISGIKAGQKAVVPNKVGLFMLQIGAIPLIMAYILGFDIPWLAGQIPIILMFVAIIGLVSIIASSFMEKGAFLGGIFWLFDVTGILGDVMSYARLAGVGLATYYLAYCFNLIAELVRGMMPAGVVQIVLGSLIFVLVLLLGHVLNLALSAITCFVHSLRLCFVEFLFKFYEGGGRAYSPFRLKGRPVFVKV